jgi:hypothetical protein
MVEINQSLKGALNVSLTIGIKREKTLPLKKKVLERELGA